MTYLSDRQSKKKKLFRLIAILLLLGVVSYAWVGIKRSLEPVVMPAFVASNKTLKRIASVPYGFVNYLRSQDKLVLYTKNLEMRAEEMENEIARLRADVVFMQGENGENGEVSRRGAIVLYPIAQDIVSLYSTLLLSKGFKDGVPEGALVYLRGRQPVCIIVDVNASTSLCKLLSASGNEVEGVVAGKDEHIALIGSGGGNYTALVPKETGLVVGDTIMYRAEASMKLGEIVEIHNDPQDTFAKAYIRGRYNPVTSNIFYVERE